MEKEFVEFKEKVYDELSDIKTNVKLLTQTIKSLSETVMELKELNKNMQIVITRQESHDEDIHELFVKHNEMVKKVSEIQKDCPAHKVEIENIKTSLEELKQDIKNKNKILIGFLVSIFTYILYQLIKLL